MPMLEAERVEERLRNPARGAAGRRSMERRGVGFDRDAHVVLLEDLRAKRLDLVTRFEMACMEIGRPELALDGMPSSPSAKEKLLAELLTPEEWEAWPVTPKGKAKSTKTRRSAARRPL